MRYRLISAFGAPLLWGCAFLLSGCPEKSQTLIDSTEDTADADFDWNVPEGQALPNVPEDNPMSEAKFQLGRHLFYDTRLSGNQTFSCASCHHQDKAFSDGLAQSLGSTGQIHPRNAQALVNVGYNSSVNWGNPVTITLENQAPIPIFGEDPVEMGVNGDNQDEVLQRFRDSELYQRLFAEAFPDETDQIDFDHIVKALSTFGRGLNSFNSPYDRYVAGEGSALSDSAVRGMEMFFSETHECFHCHGTEHFSSSSTDRTQLFSNRQFHNNGLYNLGGTGDYPEGGQGVFEVSGNAADKGAFRPPTLRNIELTAPYMHDGTIATLEDVIRHYAAGGRNITSGPNAGDGRLNPNKSSMVPGFTVTEQNVEDLVAFLESLTDHDFVTPPVFPTLF